MNLYIILEGGYILLEALKIEVLYVKPRPLCVVQCSVWAGDELLLVGTMHLINKQDSRRSSLKLTSTYSSLILVKETYIEDPLVREPT